MSRSVLFVCKGNICRSPFAERAFEASVPEPARSRLRVRSAGFYPEEGRSPPREAVRAAAELGVDVSGHRSRSLASGAGEAGASRDERPVVFVMEPGQKERYRRAAGIPARAVLVLGDFDPEPVERRRIPDPFGRAPEVFEETFARIRRCVDEVGAAWTAGSGGSESGGRSGDPDSRRPGWED